MSVIKNLLGLGQDDEFAVETIFENEWAFAVESTDEEIEGGVSDADVIAEANDELDTAVGSLEALHEMVTAALANGGLTKDSVPFVQFGIDSAIGKYAPLVKSETTFPGMESFDAEGDRMQATSIALEDLGEKLKSIWESIKAFILKWAAKVSEIYNTYNSWAKVQLVLLQRVAAKAKLAKSGVGKTVELSASEFKFLSIEGRINKTVIVEGLTTLTAAISEHSAESKIGERLIAQSTSVKLDLRDAADIFTSPWSIKEASMAIQSSTKAIKLKVEKEFNDEITLLSVPLLGNKRVKATIEGFAGGRITKKISIGLVDVAEHKRRMEGPAWTPEELNEILNAAINALKAVIASQSADKARFALLKQYTAANDSLVKSVKKGSRGESGVKAIINSTAVTARAIVEPGLALTILTRSVVSAVKNLCLKSMKSTGVEKPAKDDT